MNYTDLQVVIKEVCGKIDCPSCKSNYLESDVQIVGTTKNEGVFMVRCNKCNSNVVINVSVTRKTANITPHERQWSANDTKITSDEVIDMHNLLNSFDGDINNIIK